MFVIQSDILQKSDYKNGCKDHKKYKIKHKNLKWCVRQNGFVSLEFYCHYIDMVHHLWIVNIE